MTDRPNIVLVMVDDMGYSDLGCFGSRIRTPHIDALAEGGVRYTQFYNTARCCPARASLLTGLYPHQADVGWMTAVDMGRKGYRNNLSPACPTIAECLKTAGYSTYMSGKWHVTLNSLIARNACKDSWPRRRGFDRYYGTMGGAGNYFDPPTLVSDTTLVGASGDDYYLTDALSDKAVEFITDHLGTQGKKPFFLYLAYTAPHWPLHALPRDIESYSGVFRDGWDMLREEKYERMQRLGVLDQRWRLSERDADLPSWDSLSERYKDIYALKMAVYAAQIECMDRGTGRVVDCLRKHGLLDNTLIFFLSDNGGCHEELLSIEESDPAAYGTRRSYVSYGRAWANYSNVPFRMYKSWVHEGGIATPLIVHWPAGIRVPDSWNDRLGHITDIMPTCLEIADADRPQRLSGEVPPDLVGRSLCPSLAGEDNGRDTIFFEHEAKCALRKGNWKIARLGIDEPWELYDMSADRSELHDLSERYPDRRAAMVDEWEKLASRYDVLPLDGRSWEERLAQPRMS